jgi:membrane associated rhomboid family serine protease
MPKCVDCGAETDRDVMYGPPDELRCPVCVRKLQPIYDRSYYRPETPPPPRLSYAILAVALVATVLFWSPYVEIQRIMIHWLVVPKAIWDGQLWRFLSSCFLHANTLHLVFNLYWTFVFGRALEDWMGWPRFLGFFILSGMGASAAEFLVSPGSAIGLSGVVYAMFGLLFALRRDKDFAAEQMQPQVVQVFVGWFFICIALTVTNVLAIANVAHGAGAVIGWLVGQAVLPRRRYVLVPVITLLIVALIGATLYMPWNKQYCLHRALRAIRAGDVASGIYWMDKAGIGLPDRDRPGPDVNKQREPGEPAEPE